MECPTCSYQNAKDALVCNLCGNMLNDQAGTTKVIDSPQWDLNMIFLHCFVREPVKVTRDRPATIGRVEGNEIILPAKVVSRRHARVEHQSGSFVVIDLGSSNGTHVNEQKVTQCVVVPGDEIRIGSFIIHVRETGAAESDEADAGKTMVVAAGSNTGASGFAGKLEEMGIGEIATIVEMTRKTGTLMLRLKSGIAKIYFNNGQIINAEGCGKKGADAFYEVFKQAEGTFEFDMGPPLIKKVINAPTTSLLLEAARMIDEQGR